MVIVYLAVMEATETWREQASVDVHEYAMIYSEYSDGLLHIIRPDADHQVFYTACDSYTEYPYDTEIEWFYELERQNLDIRELYASICPQCRRLNNEAR